MFGLPAMCYSRKKKKTGQLVWLTSGRFGRVKGSKSERKTDVQISKPLSFCDLPDLLPEFRTSKAPVLATSEAKRLIQLSN